MSCCHGCKKDCRQGRDCPLRHKGTSLLPLALWLVTVCWYVSVLMTDIPRK